MKHDSIHHAYFLTSGMASLLAITEEGRPIETARLAMTAYHSSTRSIQRLVS